MSDAERITRLEGVVETMISWLVAELGMEAAVMLLARMKEEPKDE